MTYLQKKSKHGGKHDTLVSLFLMVVFCCWEMAFKVHWLKSGTLTDKVGWNTIHYENIRGVNYVIYVYYPDLEEVK